MTIAATTASSIFSTAGSDASQPTAAQAASADQGFAELLGTGDDAADNAKQELAALTQDGAAGYWTWQVKQLREKIANEVMSDMGLTKEKIAAMDTKQRVAVENKIKEVVEQTVRQEMVEETKKKQLQTMAANASMQGLISHAQSVSASSDATISTVGSAKANDLSDLLLMSRT